MKTSKSTVLEKLQKALRIVMYSILTFTLVYTASLLVTAAMNGNDKNKGHLLGYSLSLGSGSSMHPTFDKNKAYTIAIKKKVKFEDIEIGDILQIKVRNNDLGNLTTTELWDDDFDFTKYEEELLVVHRVIGKKDGGFITMGDGNSYCDDWIVYPENVHGKIEYMLDGFKLVNVENLTPKFIKEAMANDFEEELSTFRMGMLWEESTDIGYLENNN